jgi:hypothetical protein
VPFEVTPQPQVGLVCNAIGVVDHGVHGMRAAKAALRSGDRGSDRAPMRGDRDRRRATLRA